jgi:hypothetical protein
MCVFCNKNIKTIIFLFFFGNHLFLYIKVYKTVVINKFYEYIHEQYILYYKIICISIYKLLSFIAIF